MQCGTCPVLSTGKRRRRPGLPSQAAAVEPLLPRRFSVERKRKREELPLAHLFRSRFSLQPNARFIWRFDAGAQGIIFAPELFFAHRFDATTEEILLGRFGT